MNQSKTSSENSIPATLTDLSSENEQISLPVKVLFSKKMVDIFIIKNKSFSTIQFVDSTSGPGMKLEKISLRKFNTLVTNKYIFGLETTHDNLLSMRKEVNLLTDSIFQIFINMTIDNELYLSFSKIIKQYGNMKAWKYSESLDRIPISEIIRKLQNHMVQINSIKRALIQDYSKFTEKEQVNPIIQGYIENLDPKLCLQMLMVTGATNLNYCVKIISDIISSAHNKLQLAESLNILIIEMIMNAENLKIFDYLSGKKYPHDNIQKVLYDSNMRNSILMDISRNSSGLSLDYKVHSNNSLFPGNLKLRLSLINKNAQRDIITFRRKEKDVDKEKIIESNLEEYCNAPALPFSTMDMTALYLDSIKQICDNERMGFKSSISIIGGFSINAVDIYLFNYST